MKMTPTVLLHRSSTTNKKDLSVISLSSRIRRSAMFPSGAFSDRELSHLGPGEIQAGQKQNLALALWTCGGNVLSLMSIFFFEVACREYRQPDYSVLE